MKTSSRHHWFSRTRSSSPPPPSRDQPPPPAFRHGRPTPDAHPGCMAIMSYLIFSPGAGCVGRPPNSSSSHVAVVTAASPPSSSLATPGEAGLQAPRNSLDLLDADLLRRDIQIGVQIEPAFDALARPRPSAPTSEAETPRTPSLVARLMGIDGLPDSPSPATSSNSKPREKKKRVIPESISLRQPLRDLSRSLPDTPRASTSSLRPAAAVAPTWDVVDHPRLSLQVLKDNVLDRARQYMSMPTSPTSLSKKKKTRSRRDATAAADGRSSKENAVREIVRQARETVTNRKSKKNAAAIGKENASPVHHHHHCGKENAPPAAKQAAAAPPMRAPLAEQQPHAPRLPLQPRPAPPPPPPQQQRAKPSRPPPPPPPLDPPPRAAAPPAKCKRPDGCERFATRIKKPAPPPILPAQPSPTSSTDVRDIVVSGERKITSSTPAVTAPPATVEEDPEYVYLRAVLERGGFMRARAAALKGHSVETPVDPLVFHLLELELPADEARLGPLRHRWNRKLLFQLTQEMLAEQLLGLDPTSPSTSSGAALVARLWRRARSFPAADCRVVEDILALVAADVEAAARARRVVERRLVAEEGEDVAEEVAERVLDALLDAEIAAVAGGE
ncbi:uncharacterized protein [Oryza sativa Japonica Group]|uniref:OSJNBb0004G23.12 protein n=5 Tax=Oryza TaxID=4527 RepID=A0A0P0W5Y7_ORYSJ|nr:proteoglycan 4 [Oryza sativa Japonica Group]BAS87543.1 Os04g0106500 [Oryza sativa Japonica Group]CAE02760.2 OSJNBb0085F13.7 [Oryza sativa Japonica Group]CAE04614.2 OSJNBb0004G23.12 [Oryza sativa Japonica Group]